MSGANKKSYNVHDNEINDE